MSDRGVLLRLGILLLLSVPFPLMAANAVYYANASAGANNGTSCANAYAYSDATNGFNAAGNWSGSPTGTQIGPDTTVHLCGTFTDASTTQGLLKFNGSGTSGHVITLLFEANAILTDAAWPTHSNGGAISLNGQSYILIDGGTNGLIQATANGTGLANQVASTIINASNSEGNVEVRNLTMSNIYVHTSGGTGDPQVESEGCIYSAGGGTWSVHNNTMHDIGWCLNFQNPQSSSLNIYDNQIYNIDHGIALAFGGSGNSLTNANVYGNHIHDTTNWDNAGCSWHHDGIHAYNYVGGTASTWAFYNNLFDGNWGTCNTAQIYMETNAFSGLLIYNNVFLEYPGNLLNNGMMALGATTGGIYNNTLVCDPTVNGMEAATIYGTNLSIKNNLWSGCQTYLVLPMGDTFAAGGLNYNLYAGSTGGGSGAWIWSGTGESTFDAWKSASSGDANSKNPASALVGANGAVQLGSEAIGNGTNLTSLSIAALDYDYSGNGSCRLASGGNIWTMGAYCYVPPPGSISSSTGIASSSGVQ